MSILRPHIVDASARGDAVSFVADGSTIMVLTRSHALWLLARLAQALARSA